MADTYTHGHHESVLRSHKWRTAENSAKYLLEHLRPGLDLLDVGCGPGTITRELAELVAPGRVVGLDAADDVIADARATFGDAPVTWTTGDVYALDFPDDAFDVVHAHQVLQHLSDPVAALREMRRVTRPGGIVAVRDSDYATFTWAPADPRLDAWLAAYHAVTARNRAEADAGRYLLGWAHAAGFTDATMSSSTWTFADAESRAWWGSLWADRCRHSAFGRQAQEYDIATADELETMAGGFEEWAHSDDGVFIVVHGEIIGRVDR